MFPLAGVSFAIFHPRKARVAVGVIVGCRVCCCCRCSSRRWRRSLTQYASWHAIESKDALDRGFTVMQMVELLSRQDWPNWPQQLVGDVALVAPVLAAARSMERVDAFG